MHPFCSDSPASRSCQADTGVPLSAWSFPAAEPVLPSGPWKPSLPAHSDSCRLRKLRWSGYPPGWFSPGFLSYHRSLRFPASVYLPSWCSCFPPPALYPQQDSWPRSGPDPAPAACRSPAGHRASSPGQQTAFPGCFQWYSDHPESPCWHFLNFPPQTGHPHRLPSPETAGSEHSDTSQSAAPDFSDPAPAAADLHNMRSSAAGHWRSAWPPRKHNYNSRSCNHPPLHRRIFSSYRSASHWSQWPS